MGIQLNLIVAATESMGIGYKGHLPWKLKKEMAHFSRMTKGVIDPMKRNAVVMGRRTWESIPPKFRPLRGRLNVVLSTNHPPPILTSLNDVIWCSDWEETLRNLEVVVNDGSVEKIWIIGGSSIYKKAMESPWCHRIYFTRILQPFECDVFFPLIDSSKFQLVEDSSIPISEDEENGVKYRYEVYEKL